MILKLREIRPSQFDETRREGAGLSSNCLAFTLIEMIGVLAIVAILAAAILSTTSRSIDFAATNLESTNLANFATAFLNSSLRNRVIPGAGAAGVSNWVQAIGAELGVSPFLVNTNTRNARRVLMVDPNNTLTLPYTQNIGGTSSGNPPTARVMILSTIGPAFPSSFVDGTTTDFNAIWTNADGTLPVLSPLNPLSPPSWKGTGNDLMVKRIDMGSSFLQLGLLNYPPPNPPQGNYQIDRQLGNNTIKPVPVNGTNTFFLTGTILSLLDSSSNLQVDQILNRSSTFFYIQSVWRGTLDLGAGLGQGGTNLTESSKIGSAFAASIASFLSSKYNINTTTTPPMVANDMSNFMVAYISYANAIPTPFPNSGPIYAAAINTQSNMFADMTSLLINATPGGCSNAPGQTYP